MEASLKWSGGRLQGQLLDDLRIQDVNELQARPGGGVDIVFRDRYPDFLSFLTFWRKFQGDE